MDSELIAILAAVTGVANVGFRVIEKLVDNALNKRKQGDTDDLPTSPKTLKSGHSSDLAIQRYAIGEIREDIDKIMEKTRDVLSSVSKEIPHQIQDLNEKQEATLEDIKDLRECMDRLRSALENNTSATRALYELFASQLKHNR